jgi:hypothetical protein
MLAGGALHALWCVFVLIEEHLSVFYCIGTLKNSEFRSRSRRARKFFRRHIHDILRIEFDCATMRFGEMTIFQDSRMFYGSRVSFSAGLLLLLPV